MIGILSYGAGNINAIIRIFKNLKIKFKVICEPDDFDDVTKIVLPGVGAFDAVMGKLNNSGLRERLDIEILDNRLPVLGICVGMQIMAKNSEEGRLPGLGWINATVKKFNLPEDFYIPHMGWNTVNFNKESNLFENIDFNFGFYFVHSFYFDLEEQLNISGMTNYGINFCSAFIQENIAATQFHPEKSHLNGLNVLKNFAERSLC